MVVNGQRSGFMRYLGQDQAVGKRFYLQVGLLLELSMMGAGLWPAAWLVLRLAPEARTPGRWVLIILGAALIFNYGYLVALLAWRAVLPRPREGRYPVRPGHKIGGQVRLFILNFLLARARYEPPWAAMFSAVLANTFPLRFFFRRLFGPQSRSVTVGDIVCFLDPHMVEIGRNVHLGYHALVIGHVVDNRGLLIGKVRIGDDVVIGGGSLVMPGVRIGNHAVVGARSMVRPDTVIGPYEYWAGAPARKIKDLSPEEDAQTTA